VSGTKFC